MSRLCTIFRSLLIQNLLQKKMRNYLSFKSCTHSRIYFSLSHWLCLICAHLTSTVLIPREWLRRTEECEHRRMQTNLINASELFKDIICTRNVYLTAFSVLSQLI